MMRVEWRQESRQRYLLARVDRAEACFDAFRRWDEPALRRHPWRPLSRLHDPYRHALLIALVAVLLAVISVCASF